jgi:hypothetical protein
MYGHTNPTIRTTEDGEQVGPKMHSAVQSAASGPWASDPDVYPSMNQLAQSVGPNGSQDYGYRIVKRCMSKGLLTLDSDHPDATPNGRGAVIITEKGKQYLRNH